MINVNCMIFDRVLTRVTDLNSRSEMSLDRIRSQVPKLQKVQSVVDSTFGEQLMDQAVASISA